MDEAPEGIVNYLIYAVVGLCGLIFATVQKHLGGRMARVEVSTAANSEAIHGVETTLLTKMNETYRELDRKIESRRLETKEDFKLLHKKIDTNTAAILTEIRKK
jgi:hypothetical protein